MKGTPSFGAWLTRGQRSCVRFSTSSINISAALFSGPEKSAGTTTTARVRSISASAIIGLDITHRSVKEQRTWRNDRTIIETGLPVLSDELSLHLAHFALAAPDRHIADFAWFFWLLLS